MFMSAKSGAAALALAGVYSLSHAQVSSTSGVLEEIVITATRRVENLQQVPIAATALTGDALQDKAVARLADLQFAAPALTVTDAGLTQSVNIRGIGLASGSPQVANGVATYFDGLFQPPIVTTNSFYDIANVEVLRGPQGTLVGSNSTGGAIFINSRNPSTEALGGYAELAVGNYSFENLQGAINVPVSETFALRAAGNYSRRDSYYTDHGPLGNRPGRLDEESGRIGALWKPGAFQALAKVEYSNKETGGYAYRPVPTTQFAPDAYPGIRNLIYNSPTKNHERGLISSLELRYELANGVTLRSLSGYQDKKINNLYDMDATAAASQTWDQYVRERQYSEEINIISPTTGVFNWILGGYYQRNKIDVAILSLSPPQAPTNIEPRNDKITTGVFAQTGFKLSPQLELQVGARYSHFDAEGTGGVFIGRGVPGFPPGGLMVADSAGDHKDGRTTGKIALNWTPDDDNLVYAFVARGYKPGGFNSSTSEFDPETVWDYELGWKSSFLDGRVRTQLGVFYNEYKGFQFDVLDTTTGQTGVANLPDATIQGAEAQIQAQIGGFGFDAGVSYVDSELGTLTFVNTRHPLYPNGIGPLGPQCPAGVTPNPPACFDYGPFLQTVSGGPNLFSPEWTYNAGVQYEWTAGDVTVTPRVNYSYVGSSYTSLQYSPVTDYLRSRSLVSALIRVQVRGWHVEAYGTNLTDEKYVSGHSGLNEFYGAPREYGVRIGAQF
jgi:iron complex outermembrane receptor protein